MNLISWNVNGIRASLRKGFADIVTQSEADIFCLQETKANPEQVNLSDYPIFSEYHAIWNSAERRGYSGVLIFCKSKPLSFSLGIGAPEHDKEGRVITCDFGDFQLVNVYTPNSGDQLARLDYRQAWDKAFREYVCKLAEKKPLLICGDLNVAHEEIDLARPGDNHHSAGFTDEEREGFRALLGEGFKDSFRLFNQDGENYTWWSYRTRARERNVGWRIDYWLASEDFTKNIARADIHSDIHGSDHCPVSVQLS